MGKSNNQKRIQWVVNAALLLALLVVVQLLTKAIPTSSVPIVSQLFTGSLVNLVLIIGAGAVGFSAAAIAAVLSPVLAFAMGQMAFVPMIPVVMLGNLVIVAIVWALIHKGEPAKGIASGKNILGMLLGAAAKFIFLWGATALIAVPLFFSKNPKVASKLLLMFSWPQLITALIGGVLALLILPSLRTFYQKKS